MFRPARFHLEIAQRVHWRWLVTIASVCAGVLVAAGSPATITSAPFNSRSKPDGETLFTTLSAKATGIDVPNPYDDPSMWRERYREFSLGAIGTGVAIGDFDSDGKPDLYVVCKTGPNHLFKNLGGFRFVDVTSQAGVAGPIGAWKQGAAFADINNDGQLDLYVCRFAAPNLLYVNQGDGTFKEEAAARGLALVSASGMGSFCDYDRDGWLDVYVQTNLLDGERRPNGQRDRLYHNNRDGTFNDVTDAAGIAGETQGHSATWWDYNEDGWPDLYVANDFKDPDTLYRNNGDGTFTNVLSWVVPHTPHSSMGADFGDVNNDGHVDLLVADMAATTREKDQRGMAKLRSGLAENEARPEAAPQLMRNALYLNMGAGVALEAAMLTGLAATDWTWSVRFEDLDNDGWLDAYFTNGMIRELHNADIVQRMAAKESLSDRVRVMKATPPLLERHLAFRNRGELEFENVSAAWGLDHLGLGSGAAFGDLDGDGDLDLVFTSIDGPVTVCRNDSTVGHALILELLGTTSNRAGLGASVTVSTDAGRQVRVLNPARGYLSSSEPIVHFGLGADTRVRKLVIDWPSGRSQEFTDLAVDQRYAITEDTASTSAPNTARAAPQFVEMSQSAHLNGQNRDRLLDELSKQPLLPYRLNRAGPPVVAADLDGDGEDDLAMGGVAGEKGQLFSNLGGGQFLAYGGSLFGERTSIADGPMLAMDFDGDGDLDLLLTKTGTAAELDSGAFQPRLLLNDRTGQFTSAPTTALPELPISVGAVAAADFERSGRLGVFVGGRVVPGHYPEAPRSALLVVRDGKFVDVTADVCPALVNRGMVTSALWSDVDDDGWIDLLVTYDWGPVACYRNIEGKRLEDVSTKLGFAAEGNGWWRSSASADFNGDGRPDFAVGNIGLNTPYHGSPEFPTVLYAGVSLEGSAPQLLEVQEAQGKWYPLRSREILGRAFPSLAKKFPTFDGYARATLEEIFPADVLAGARKFSASELRSGVFLSQPDGAYHFQPLPRLAQIAPVSGMIASDVDGDGRADILVVGNWFGPIPEVGRFDGGVGWLLRGDGKGNFDPVEPAASGWIVRRDAKALALVDFDRDGWPDFFVTRNNDRSLAFRNGRVAGHNSFGVSLRGPMGNPSAIGARLILKMTDGSRQVQEIAAGSGFFTQSSATAFFGYRDLSRPTELDIRWPDGRMSTHAFDKPPPKIVRLSAP